MKKLTKTQQYYTELRGIVFDNFKLNKHGEDYKIQFINLQNEVNKFKENQTILKKNPKNKDFLYLAIGDKIVTDLFKEDLLDDLIKKKVIKDYNYNSVELYVYNKLKDVGLYHIINTSPDVCALKFITQCKVLIENKYNKHPRCKDVKEKLDSVLYELELSKLNKKYNRSV